MAIFFGLIFCIYYLVTSLLIVGFTKAIKKNTVSETAGKQLKISVVIPFKNEEPHLMQLIQALKSQNYPQQNFEVIFVDDHSNDGSVSLVMHAINELPNFKLISTGWGDVGKKKALTHGVDEARYGIVVTTDADCVMNPNWLVSINKVFQRPEVELVFGGVAIKENNSFFSKLQAMEFSSLIASGAATLSFGAPSMCNGANLAFRSFTFAVVKGYEGNFEIASGDDEFLMRKIHERYPKGIVFMNEQDGIVATQPQQTISEFIDQRLRWAAKLPHNPSWSTKVLGWYIILFQASYLGLIGLLFTKFIPLKFAFTLLAIKLLLEFIFLFRATRFLKVKWRIFSFLSLQLLYPLYVVFVGIFSNFLSFNWKGVKYKM